MLVFHPATRAIMTTRTTRTYRLDYRPPAFLVDTLTLRFELDPEATVVTSRLHLRRNPAHGEADSPLCLDGEGLTLLEARLDDKPLPAARYTVSATGLTLPGLGNSAVLELVTRIAPAANTELSGLYLSGGAYFTQCEAEGFRRITFFPDRPDVLTRITTTLVAPSTLPVLLSNGNPAAAGTLPDGRHFATWDDPHPKPCYLFALVAGDLVAVRDHFRTRSGRDVPLAIWVRRGDEGRCGHAMAALRASMKWDEDVFGLEYDLDVFNIAAVADFNMGAMENKGLNIFNTKYILADQATATDEDYENIERVIAHEYFHNWTGNRVTCRDWFQLSLKEGLTVFRDQLFGADRGSPAMKRIADVRRLRAIQFPEDAGPLAHPVRPDSYVAIDNFYTPTVYEKGAEICRMLSRRLGADGFRRGLRCYLSRHDHQAVTLEDFLRALSDGSGTDVMEFLAWYGQAGTPLLSAAESYDAKHRRFVLTLCQRTAPTPGQAEKRPLPIPVAVGLLAPDGAELPARLAGEGARRSGTWMLLLEKEAQDFVFEEVETCPVPSLLRGFSAPVQLVNADAERLRFLASHDSDPFVRWDAGQRHAMLVLQDLIAAVQKGQPLHLDGGLLQAQARLLAEADADRRFAAEALTLPAETVIADQMEQADPDAIHTAREFLRRELAQRLAEPLRATYRRLTVPDDCALDGEAIGRRALRNVCLSALAAAGEEGIALAATQFATATMMTDSLAALSVLARTDSPERPEALASFYRRWQKDALVLDKWFAIQAASPRPQTVEEVAVLARHPTFELANPNRVRALVGTFSTANPVCFHAASGAGYAFLAEMVIAVDRLNGQAAARLVGPLCAGNRQQPARQALMREQLRRIQATPGLSRFTSEQVARGLG
jgi:aminopeptidase N